VLASGAFGRGAEGAGDALADVESVAVEFAFAEV
jgi:hypothetical protein